MSQTITRRSLGVSLAALAAATSTIARAAAPKGDKPLYKDPTQSVELRVRDLLSRMTLEEKAAQLVGIWLTKNKIQTDAGEFSPEAASKNFPNGLGQISRPSDRKGLKPATVVDAAPAPTTARSTATPRKPRATSTPPRSGRWRRRAWASRC